ncbi:MAG: hypothetical protein WBE26_05320, partial [Phycisphaerae bacterium]
MHSQVADQTPNTGSFIWNIPNDLPAASDYRIRVDDGTNIDESDADFILEAPDACCMPNGLCEPLAPQPCIDAGGSPQPPGTTCTTPGACCTSDDTCEMLDPLCCVDQGGEPSPPDICTLNRACCFFEDGSCADLDPLCCHLGGGHPQGPASLCLGDMNVNGFDDACEIVDCEVQTLIASDAAPTDVFGVLFGWAVSISGEVAVIGTPFDDDACIPDDFDCNSGSAYIYRFNGSTWIEDAKLTASDAAQYDEFGISVSVSGDTAVVATWRDDCAAGSLCGSAYVFEKPPGGWVDMTETAKLTVSDAAAGDYFGTSVSISGDVILIGAQGKDCLAGSDCGAAYVFEKPPGGWVDMTETAKLTAFDGAEDDGFGLSVSISGDVILIGASGKDCLPSSDCGAAYVFEKPPGGWVDTTEAAKLTAFDAAPSDGFGASVSINSEMALVGAHSGDGLTPCGSAVVPNSGSAYVFEMPPGGWVHMTETAKLTASDAARGDYFGSSVSISGDVAVVGSEYGGSAYVYRFDGIDWVEGAKLLGSESAYFGFAVSVSGNVVVVGAPLAYVGMGRSGSAYVYQIRGGFDCNSNTINDACEADCNANGVPDDCDINEGTSEDCNGNAIPDECDVDAGTSTDCNNNGILDVCDIDSGTSLDCQPNSIPDECEAYPGFADASGPLSPIDRDNPQSHTIISPPDAIADVALWFEASADLGSTSEFIDVDINGIPVGRIFESRANYCPAEPDTAILVIPAVTFNVAVGGGDAVINMVPSSSVYACASSFITVTVLGKDCNGNSIHDDCDIADGTSLDCQPNGTPDECETLPFFTDGSGPLSPIDEDNPQSHTITSPPVATADVTFSFTASADLSSTLEFIDVDINGIPVGRIFESGASDCPAEPDTATLFVLAAVYNTAIGGGDAVINMVPGTYVDADTCPSSFITVTVEYEAGRDCNGNSVPDDCDIADGTSLDCQRNGIPDDCDIANGTSQDSPPNGIPDECEVAICVDDHAPPGGDGTCWSSPFKYLQDALAVATVGAEVRVAEGTYRPDQDEAGNVTPGDRDATFQLISGVTIQGGYAGYNAPDPNERDFVLYESVLSGDLNEDDGPDYVEDFALCVSVEGWPPGPACDAFDFDEDGDVDLDDDLGTFLAVNNYTDSTYHVVTGGGVDARAWLDGFTITSGNANGSGSRSQGAGMLNVSGSPTLINCTFSGNAAGDNGGGGMSNDGGDPALTDCIFSGNVARHVEGGGGMHNANGSNPTLIDCMFASNASGSGGGMCNVESSPVLTVCTFGENLAVAVGAGMFNELSDPTLTNCHFTGNMAGYNAGGMYNYDSGPAMINCTFSENSAGSGGGGMYSYFHSSPSLADCNFSDNYAGNSGGGMYNRFLSSSSLADCNFTGNYAEYAGGGMYNEDTTLEVTNCTFSGNSAGSRGGGIYRRETNLVVTNCTFSGNVAADYGGGMYGSARSTNCTFSGNVAGNYGGGIYVPGGTLVAVNCILWRNADSSGIDERAAQVYPVSKALV